MINTNYTKEEAIFVTDVLQMWLEGIESEVVTLSTSTDAESHWSKHQLRKQFDMAGRLKLRLQLDLQEQAS